MKLNNEDLIQVNSKLVPPNYKDSIISYQRKSYLPSGVINAILSEMEDQKNSNKIASYFGINRNAKPKPKPKKIVRKSTKSKKTRPFMTTGEIVILVTILSIVAIICLK